VIENDPVADSIRQLVSFQPWEGTATSDFFSVGLTLHRTFCRG